MALVDFHKSSTAKHPLSATPCANYRRNSAQYVKDATTQGFSNYHRVELFRSPASGLHAFPGAYADQEHHSEDAKIQRRLGHGGALESIAFAELDQPFSGLV